MHLLLPYFADKRLLALEGWHEGRISRDLGTLFNRLAIEALLSWICRLLVCMVLEQVRKDDLCAQPV